MLPRPRLSLHRLPCGSARTVSRSLAAALLLAVGCARDPEWRGTPVVPALQVPPLTFTDSAGAGVALVSPSGSATVVFFGYTNCPDVCPTTLADWVRVKQALGAEASRVRFVFVTVDPERDTPAVAQRYAAQFDPSFIGVSGSREETIQVQEAFKVASVKQPSTSAAGYLMGHSAQTFLMDDRGRVLVSYGFGAGWDVMSADLKQLLR